MTNPHANAEKAGKVRAMFTSIAGSYDLNNRLHSLWQDVRWRRFAVRRAEVMQGDVVLDVACGTGDLSEAFAKTVASRVVAVDFTPAMLEKARERQQGLRPDVAAKLTYSEGDAMNLAFPDESFDIVSISFGLRNVTDSRKALREFARVLRPGGRLIVLEFTRPKNRLTRWFNDVYCCRIMPWTATAIAGDKSGAYRYLPMSVATYLSPEEMLLAMSEVGLKDPSARRLTAGICACYRAYKVS